ncbi:hypothetical protein BDM02DRAFT_2345997 [Thelephora ganbajun]|uniref:Uncharacterized protein n=1 Tax=Thelephora ganbajun TaxID=370292 RepID=A0ACB6ZG90_THEGA|nr:hypothetical protein BDM02DRAFT_2345997 [Thelephora ganbajun]
MHTVERNRARKVWRGTWSASESKCYTSVSCSHVQNLASQTYLEILEHSRELCCRPATVLTSQDASWEFQPSGSGYSIKKVEQGKPEQYCNAVGGLFFGFGNTVSATAFPTAWRVEVVNDIKFQGFGYVRMFWGSSNKALDLSWWGSSKDGTKVGLWEHIDINSDPWRIWKLIPVENEDLPTGLDIKKDEVPPKYSAKG